MTDDERNKRLADAIGVQSKRVADTLGAMGVDEDEAEGLRDRFDLGSTDNFTARFKEKVVETAQKSGDVTMLAALQQANAEARLKASQDLKSVKDAADTLRSIIGIAKVLNLKEAVVDFQKNEVVIRYMA